MEQVEALDDTILYELLVYSEWGPDQETGNKNNDVGFLWKNLAALLATRTGASYISEWVTQQLRWQLAIGAEGKAIAILQDNCLEIRTSRDKYSAPIGKTNITKDNFPKWRKIEWSPDGTILAVAHSNGVIDVYDLLATHIFQIPSASNISSRLTHQSYPETAVAGLIFADTRTKNTHWSWELICIGYSGQLRAFFVSVQGFEPSHTFSFSSHLPLGITAVTGDNSRHLLVVASPTCFSSDVSIVNHQGLTGDNLGLKVWRMLDERPFYAEVPSATNIVSKPWLRSFRKRSYVNTVVKLSISPDGTSISAIHCSGTISLWSMPTLRCKSVWPLDRQPGFDELNPKILQLPAHRRVRSPTYLNPLKHHPVDVNWWSEDSIIVARVSGAVVIYNVADFFNRLGSSAEFFEGSPRISSAFNGMFLGLECEVKVQKKRLQAALNNTATSSVFDAGQVEEDVEELSEEEESYPVPGIARSLLYWATDSERFQPPRKRPKLISRTYRLLGFKKTTPEELYGWKLDAEEYGEALALARAYGLDCDLVYQRQWRNASASVATIHDYLSKVSKRDWVLRECLGRVPEDVDAVRELLTYGLKNTDAAIVAGGRISDVTKWKSLDYDETEEEVRQKEESHRRQWLAKIDFSNLTVEQKVLISTRRRLLQYLDRLSIYEVILGGAHLAPERFSPSFFEEFRSQSALESTIQFAHQGDWQAVAIMFTYNGAQTLPHRLTVCSNFPETLAPLEYRSVLPECDINGDVFPWDQESLREPDWSESPAVKMAVDTEVTMENESAEAFYDEEPKLKLFRSDGVDLNTHLVSEWYKYRSADIERQSMLIMNSVDLIKLGLERNVPGLERIHHQLLTLETIVYDLSYDHLNLEKLNAMSELAVCQLIMSRCDNETFMPTLNRWLMPYLRRLDTLRPGSVSELLRSLLVAKSKEDLSWILQICSNSKSEQSTHLISEPALLISLALECLYACQQTNQLENAMKIYDCLPERPSGSHIDPVLNELHDKLDVLQTHLEAADVLANYGIPMTPAMIAAKQSDADQIEQLFIRLTRTVLRNQNDNEWKDLNEDMLDLQRKVFSSITPQTCYEILVGSLLSSAKKTAIKAAGALLQLEPSSSASSIPFERSKKLILEAAEEYFNSSENLSDPCLEMASYCLGLITVADDQIQEAKDLISAAHLLHEYGLDMPPLKIRLSRNRFVFIDQVLKYAGKAYKNSSRLVRLAQLLRACGRENAKELEGEVFVRIAEIAILKQDFEVADQICNKIRLANYSGGWKVCSRLANIDDINDLSMRISLVSFAVVYCPPEVIEELLQLQWNLEKRHLRGKCSKLLESYIIYENGDENLMTVFDQPAVEVYRREAAKKKLNQLAHKPAKGAEKGKVQKQVLQTTADTTKQIVNVVRSTFKLNERESKSTVAKSGETNRDCNQWAAPAFYYDCCFTGGRTLHESSLEASYRVYSMPEVARSELNLLAWSWRTSVLDALQRPLSPNSGFGDDILTKLSECLFPEDCLLALGHLLDLGKGDRAWEPMTRLPSTEITLQMAAYYFALRIMSLADTNNLEFICVPPRRLIDKCAALDEAVLSDEQRAYRDLLSRSLRLLSDISEAQQLRRLDSGVDINRFTTDDLYKHDTIVGLAITSDPNIYSAAVRLAKHYGVSQWEVTFSHLTALFTDDDVAPSRIRQLIDEHGMSQVLLQDKSAFGRKMLDVIYPNISGRDHERLGLFFDVIKSDPVTNGMINPPADVLAKILQKVASLKGLDLKKITKSPESFAHEVERTVNAETVGKLAKLTQQLASSVEALKAKISPGMVHSIWARKYFFSLIDEQKNPAETDWYYRFESCKPHFSKLSPDEFLKLADGMCFSNEALGLLTPDVRAEIANRSLKLLRDRLGKNVKDPSSEACLKRLENWVDHLNRLRQDYYHELRTEVMSLASAQFWREFEQSRAEEASLYRLLLRLLIERHPLSIVQLFIGAFPPSFSSTPEDVLGDVIRLTLEHLRRTSASKNCDEPEGNALENLNLFKSCDAIQVLMHLLMEAHHFLENGDDTIGLLSIPDIEEMVQQFCVDDNVDVDIRLQLLLMLQSLPCGFSALSEESGSRVQWLRTLAVIKQTWCTASDTDDVVIDFNQITGSLREEDLKSEEHRRKLFTRLLELSTEIRHLNALAKLLNCWAPFDSNGHYQSTPWIKLWEAITKTPTFPNDALVIESLKLALEHYEKHQSIPQEGLQLIDQSLKSASHVDESTASSCVRLRLHVALKSSLPQLVDEIIIFLNAKPELTLDSYDAEILDMILERGLVGKLANTPLYAPLCERLLSLPSTLPSSPSSVESVARQLIEHGHRSEAGHILQLTRGLPRYLMNFTSSLYFARRQGK